MTASSVTFRIPLCVVLLLSPLLLVASPVAADDFDRKCVLTDAVSRLNEGPSDYSGLNMRPTGTVRAVMIFVDFSDAIATEATDVYKNHLVPSARSYFSDVSYGRLDLRVESVDEWYRMPHPAKSYGFERGLTFYEHHAYVADAVSAADADVDFSAFDVIYITAVRTPSISYSPTYLANPGNGVVVDGDEKRLGVTFGNDMWVPQWGWRILAHETGHLFGLPDLYSFDATDHEAVQRFAGQWDPMASVDPAVHFLAWHKVKMGWLDATHMECLAASGTIETSLSPLSAPGGTKLIAVRTGPSTAYVAEVRRRAGADASLCDEGVIIYSVDSAKEDGYGPVRVQAADESSGLCGPLSHAPFDPGTAFEDTSAGVKFEILSKSNDGSHVVRATYTGSYIASAAPPEQHAPAIGLRLGKHLVARGAVTLGDRYQGCFAGVTVTVEKKKGTSYVAVTTAVTTASGSFSTKLPDKTGVYRASIPATSPTEGDSCASAVSATRKHAH